MKFNSWRFYMGTMALVSTAYAQDIPYKYSGVHYDPVSEQYFVNDRPMFNIKPLGNSNFLDRIEYSIDDVAFAPYTTGIKFSQEGVHTLRFKAVDPVNNWSPIQSFRIFADLTKPTSQLNWFGDSYVLNGKNFISPRSKLVITANDNLSGVSRVIYKKSEGQVSEYKGPHSFDKEGEYNLNFMAIDNVGNFEPWQIHSFVVDGTPPQTDIHLKGDSFKTKDKIYTRFGAVVELSSLDNGSGLKENEVKINGDEVQKYERPITLDKKVSRIKFRGIDNVGNEEKWQNFEVHVDSDAPEVKIKKIGNHHLLGGKVFATPGFKLEMNLNDKDSGIKAVTINNQEKAAVQKDYMTFDKEGTFEVTLSAFDNVGNKSTPQNISVVIDNTPPISKTQTDVPMVEKDGILYSAVPNKLAILSDDQGVGVHQIEISYDGKVYHKLAGDIDFTTWKQPQKTIWYRSKDHLGNTEPEKKLTIAIRDKGPMVGLFVETDELGNIPLSEVRTKKGRTVSSEKPKAK